MTAKYFSEQPSKLIFMYVKHSQKALDLILQVFNLEFEQEDKL